MQLDIDDQLYDSLSQRAQEKGFDSAEEYSIVILKTVIDELDSQASNEDVQTRLQDLGYLE